MTLKTLFALPITVILVVTLSLAAVVTGQTWTGLARGRAAVLAVERMKILLSLDGSLATERITTNVSLAAPWPLPDATARRLAAVRHDADAGMEALTANLRSGVNTVAAPAVANVTRPPPDVLEILVKLGSARAVVDALLATDHPGRSFEALHAIVPLMLASNQALEGPLASAALDVIAADPSMSGLLALARLGTFLRAEVSRVAWVLIPRSNKREQMTPAELSEVERRLSVASAMTRLMQKTIEIVGPTERMRAAITELKRWDDTGELSKLGDILATGPKSNDNEAGILLPQRVLIPWGDRIGAVRAAILEAIVTHVVREQAVLENRLHVVMAALGAVLVAVLESVVLLRGRVVQPLAQLGLAITRIAGGDRTSRLTLRSGTREISEMVTAVETLRQAALVADDAAFRQRLAARQRLDMLHEALGIAQTVREPARELERGVASLSEGIDATIALVSTATNTPPATLGVAANAVRVGLAEMRDSIAEFEATFVAASKTQAEDPPEAEFVARILAVQAQVERRDEAVRAFIKPSLVALRDAASVSGNRTTALLRDLVSDQFQRVEETVAMLAAMRDAVARATSIVRGLPMDDGKIAA